ncbi:MAG TPA: glucose-6-phosphate dehydrogenase [Beijerinckiaceae bacterium]|nr:glucose-6-phosphate dehydrogenase [Beijerinckiaceae bacterium]
MRGFAGQIWEIKMDAIADAAGACAHEGAPRPPDCGIVIFGAGGDLTKRLLMPALANLQARALLPERFAIFGFNRGKLSDEAFRDSVLDGPEGGQTGADPRAPLREHLFYVEGKFDDESDFKRLAEHLRESQKTLGTKNILFYLATAPRFFAVIIEQLGRAGLTREEEGGFRRIVIEKPFGEDLSSARELNTRILKVVGEQQIYRIDHFLGKETVQNIMALRFANAIFEPIWNRHHVESVQITAAETVGVETRGAFYDKTGALRDMVPNHMFQLLGLVAMEAPNSFDADAVRTEKARVIEAIRPLKRADIAKAAVRGQYRAGRVEGRAMPDYRKEPEVAPDSATETYVALRFEIDNWRWAGVPFYVRTGKAMARRRTEVAIRFRPVPFMLFRGTPTERASPNVLTLHIQPDEGITLAFEAKRPGPAMELSQVGLDFHYKDWFDVTPTTGYETLIYDCLIGDPTLFQRADNIEAGWRAVQPILDVWGEGDGDIVGYEAGSWGPAEADVLLARDGQYWRD